MRVIAGRWGGRRLVAPPHAVRPTQDRVRQILFDILGTRVVNARVLDLCAGSGSLGIEALSRGAARAVFVESSGKACAVLAENLTALDARESASIVRLDLFRGISRLEADGSTFDWILADPPYDTALGADLLRYLGTTDSPILAPAGGVVLEGRADDRTIRASGSLRLVRERRIGGTVLWFLARETEEVPGDASSAHRQGGSNE